MNMTIYKEDYNDIERVINSDDFVQFLLSHTTSFSAATWILQTLHDQIKEIKSNFEEE